LKESRREFLARTGAAAVGARALFGSRRQTAPSPSPTAPKSFDVAVIGAGAFGAWTAWHLAHAGRRVVLVDAYGPGNSRASSGGESRVIRLGYGPDELYTRLAARSLRLWKELEASTGQRLFQPTGVLWMARGEDSQSTSTLETLKRLTIPHQKLSRKDLDTRWPQIAFGPVTWAIFEPASGALMARRAVQAVVAEATKAGAVWKTGAAAPLSGSGRLDSLRLQDGTSVAAGVFVFACGPWLPKVFPELLGDRIFPTRQEVFYFGPPPGDARFASPAMPVWVDFADEIYGLPDIESKGFKVAPDRHGPPFDPDSGDRRITAEGLASVREYVSRRFPDLASAPLVAGEVCQYENTSNGDFLIDKHPDRENVWLVGGGSGHGFKHGPAVGEYTAKRVAEGGTGEKRFSLETKEKVQKRTVF
jgi:monomeric sarcosine oxidase